MKLSLSHIAIACPSMDAVVKRLKTLSLKVESTHEVPTEKVKAAFIPTEVSPHFRLELVEPTSPESPIAKFLGTRPNGGLHHICFAVEDLDGWKRVLDADGIEILPPGIRPAARGRALFIHPSHMAGVLIELEEIHESATRS